MVTTPPIKIVMNGGRLEWHCHTHILVMLEWLSAGYDSLFEYVALRRPIIDGPRKLAN